MQAENLYRAIEQLRNELIVRDDERRDSINEIKAHLKTLNGRTRKSEQSITRLNLVVFRIAGPVGTLALGYLLKFVVG